MLPTRVPHLEDDPGDRPPARSALEQATEREIVGVGGRESFLKSLPAAAFDLVLADLFHSSSPLTPETPAQKVVERGEG